MNALLDKDFLRELDNYQHREVYARISALSINESPIQMIEGQVTGGSVNIDGASAVRRTCSLSLVAQDININDFYWGLNNKFKLEIGLKNFINSNYPDIIWFPQGVYIITSFSTQTSANGFTISISGKDKMCMLNGEVGGSIPMSTDFGVDQITNDDGSITYSKVPIKTIIKELLHAYALEPYHNIIINDLDDKGLELLEYKGEDPLYLAYDIDQGIYTQMYFSGETECIRISDGKTIRLNELDGCYNQRVDEIIADAATEVRFKEDGARYTISKIEFGQTVGYRLTDLIYPGELISNIGESITSILDKIVKMLGNFEYFYDLYGRFIFQAKKTYVNTSWSPIIETDDDMYVENAAYIDSNTYYFNGNNLISSLSNSPNWNNVKNDYAIWGVRKSVSGAELPVHFRYAIHKKPKSYKSISLSEKEAQDLINIYPSRYGNMSVDKLKQTSVLYTANDYDWRELIYQMALDYFKYGSMDNFHLKIIQSNPEEYPTGITGYESFYTDIQGFWRQMYDPQPKEKYYEYYYGSNSERQFSPIDSKKEPITKLFVLDNYEKLSKDSENVDKMKVMALREYDGELELHPLIDTIPIKYVWTEKGEQDRTQQEDVYYITADNEAGYKEISESFYKRIEKKEIYVYRNNKFISILDTVSLDDNCYLKTYVDEETPNDIFDATIFPQELVPLYYSNGKFNKYYLTSPLELDGSIAIKRDGDGNPIDKDGNVIEDGKGETVKLDKIHHYLTYYMESYDFFRTEDAPNLDLLYWNKDIKHNPDQLNFWIDFLDTDKDDGQNCELSQYSILTIGDRPKVVNDSDVKSIYYRNVPNLIFATNITHDDLVEKSGYEFMRISEDMSLNYFSISAQGKSAKDALDELLYQHSYCTESINITAIPVYYLQPNTRISVRDDQSKINGEYIVSRISLPLTYNGQMSISATKAPQRFN